MHSDRVWTTFRKPFPPIKKTFDYFHQSKTIKSINNATNQNRTNTKRAFNTEQYLQVHNFFIIVNKIAFPMMDRLIGVLITHVENPARCYTQKIRPIVCLLDSSVSAWSYVVRSRPHTPCSRPPPDQIKVQRIFEIWQKSFAVLSLWTLFTLLGIMWCNANWYFLMKCITKESCNWSNCEHEACSRYFLHATRSLINYQTTNGDNRWSIVNIIKRPRVEGFEEDSWSTRNKE